jgi:hypothetical protein
MKQISFIGKHHTGIKEIGIVTGFHFKKNNNKLTTIAERERDSLIIFSTLDTPGPPDSWAITASNMALFTRSSFVPS